MKVLVTGTAGFLGPHVARRLVADGHIVTGFDIAAFDLPDVFTIIGDLRDAAAVGAAVKGQQVVCHLGGVGDVYLAERAPMLTAASNVRGSTNVANAARRTGAKVIFASTWEVYGHPIYEPVDEDHPCSPHNVYAITKLAAERLLLEASRLGEVPVISLRLGTCFGSGLRANSVFRIFLDRAARGEPIVVHGDGSQARQFVHTDDVAACFSLACTSNVRSVALNVVPSRCVSIRDLADRFASRYGVGITFGQTRASDVPTAVLTGERAERVLGWRPQVSFEQGFAELIESADINSPHRTNNSSASRAPWRIRCAYELKTLL